MPFGGEKHHFSELCVGLCLVSIVPVDAGVQILRFINKNKIPVITSFDGKFFG